MERVSQKDSYAHQRQKERMNGNQEEWMDGWMDRQIEGHRDERGEW